MTRDLARLLTGLILPAAVGGWGSGIAAADEPPRRMSEALRALVHEDAKQVPRDPKFEDLPPEAREAIVPAREVDVPPPPPPKTEDSVEDAVKMDPYVVETPRETRIRQALEKIDLEARRIERKTKPTTLDRVLNDPRWSFLGPANAEARAAQARFQLRVMRMERLVLVLIEAAESEAEKAELREMLLLLRDMQRSVY